jgi:hypothetical protein
VLLKEQREVVEGVLRTREDGGLVVIELPPVPDDTGAEPDTGPTLHDDVDRLPLRGDLAARLHAAGFHRVADAAACLSDAGWTTAETAELRFAVERYARHVNDPATALAPIDARLLAAATTLDLPPAVKKKVAANAPTLADVVTRSESFWLKTRGFSRENLAALRAALAKLGLRLGAAWWDLAVKGEAG